MKRHCFQAKAVPTEVHNVQIEPHRTGRVRLQFQATNSHRSSEQDYVRLLVFHLSESRLCDVIDRFFDRDLCRTLKGTEQVSTDSYVRFSTSNSPKAAN